MNAEEFSKMAVASASCVKANAEACALTAKTFEDCLKTRQETISLAIQNAADSKKCQELKNLFSRLQGRITRLNKERRHVEGKIKTIADAMENVADLFIGEMVTKYRAQKAWASWYLLSGHCSLAEISGLLVGLSIPEGSDVSAYNAKTKKIVSLAFDSSMFAFMNQMRFGGHVVPIVGSVPWQALLKLTEALIKSAEKKSLKLAKSLGYLEGELSGIDAIIRQIIEGGK